MWKLRFLKRWRFSNYFHPSSWRINKVFKKLSKVMNFLNIITFLSLENRFFVVVSPCCVLSGQSEPGARIDLISPWCYFLSSLSSTILLNNSSQSDKKWWNNTRTSQKQMGSHNTPAITRRDGHFLCPLSNSFSNRGRKPFKYVFFHEKRASMLRENYPNITVWLRILKIIFKKMHFAVKLSVPAGWCSFYTDWLLLVLTDILALSRKL